MSNNLENTELEELVSRYESLISKYVELSAELATKLDKFGKMRMELQVITAEFVRRGYDPKTHDSLEQLLKQEIEKRNQPNESETNSP